MDNTFFHIIFHPFGGLTSKKLYAIFVHFNIYIMKQIFLIGLMMLATLKIAGQTQNVDSLVNVLETQKLKPKEQFKIYNDICYDYLNSDPPKAKLYIQKALLFAEKENDKSWMSAFNTYMGSIYRGEGNYDKAVEYYNKAIELAGEAKVDHRAAFAYNSMADVCMRKGENVTSLDYLMKALSIFEKGKTLDYKREEIRELANIGSLHNGMENPDLAIQFLTKAEKMADSLNFSDLKMPIYYTLGNALKEKKEFEKALDYALKSLNLSHISNDKIYESANLQSLALIYQQGFRNYAIAEKYANESLDIAKKLNDPFVIMGAWNVLSNVYLSQEKYSEAENAAMTAWKIDSTNMDLAVYLTYNIGIANVFLENKEKASYYLEKSIEISKEKTNKSFQNLLLDMETKYETQKKETRIASLEKDRRLYSWLGITGAFLAVSLGVLLWQKERNARKEKQLIAAQSVQDGELNERARLAEDLHDRLGGSLSAVKFELQNAENLQNVGDRLDQCMKEVREITHNLMPRSLRLFGMKGALEDFCTQFPNVHFHFFGKAERVRERLEFAVYS